MSEPHDGDDRPTTVLCPDCGDLGTYPHHEAKARGRVHLQVHLEIIELLDSLSA